MIETSNALGEAMLQGVLTALGSEASIALFSDTRPAAGDAPGASALVLVPLANPAGSIANGVLTLATSGESQLTAAGTPVWARIYGTGGAWLWDCDARLQTATDNGEELVLDAPAVYPGAFVRISGGTLRI